MTNITKEMAEAKEQEAEFRREVTWQADLGLIFKDRLAISAEGIRLNSQTWKVEEVTSITFGGVRHSISGIPTGTRFHVGIAGSKQSASIELSDATAFEAFTSRLMRTVGIRLMVDLAKRLRSGERIIFGSAVLDDQGVELEKYKLFGKNPRARFTWGQISVWIGEGAFNIANSQDKGFIATLSYIESANTHVLEALIRVAFKKGVDRLSDAFSE